MTVRSETSDKTSVHFTFIKREELLSGLTDQQEKEIKNNGSNWIWRRVWKKEDDINAIRKHCIKLLTRVCTKDVQYGLHKTQNVFTTRTHFGQKEHQTDTSSELRAEGSTYHVCSRCQGLCFSWEKRRPRRPRKKTQHFKHQVAIGGYSRLRPPGWLRWWKWRRWRVWWAIWWCRPRPAWGDPAAALRDLPRSLNDGETSAWVKHVQAAIWHQAVSPFSHLFSGREWCWTWRGRSAPSPQRKCSIFGGLCWESWSPAWPPVLRHTVRWPWLDCTRAQWSEGCVQWTWLRRGGDAPHLQEI